jgi:general L-amino acid transport system substrate-binding protein
MNAIGLTAARAAAAGLLAMAMIGAAGTAEAATLDVVKARGQLVCGVNTGLAGFSLPDSQGVWRGLDVDYCRAIAAATLGDGSKVRFVPLTAANRFTAVQSGEIDVLLRNSTETMARDTSLGLTELPMNFYDGQGFVVKRDAKITKLEALDGATVCVAQGTTHEKNMFEWFSTRGLKVQPVVFESVETMYQAFVGGRCDAVTQDGSALAAAVANLAGGGEAYDILPERISKEPLGPFVRQGDEAWAKIVRWVFNAMVDAEELGVTQANADEMARSSPNPEVKRLLGQSDDLGKPLGLDKAWSANVIRQVGNYGESFERNVGKSSPLKLARGLNDLWTRGGLMYAIPVR